jgi:hypothetical protein
LNKSSTNSDRKKGGRIAKKSPGSKKKLALKKPEKIKNKKNKYLN